MSVRLSVMKLIITTLLQLWCSGIIKSSRSEDVAAIQDLNSSFVSRNINSNNINNTVYENDVTYVKEHILTDTSKRPEHSDATQNNYTGDVFMTYSDKTVTTKPKSNNNVSVTTTDGSHGFKEMNKTGTLPMSESYINKVFTDTNNTDHASVTTDTTNYSYNVTLTSKAALTLTYDADSTSTVFSDITYSSQIVPKVTERTVSEVVNLDIEVPSIRNKSQEDSYDKVTSIPTNGVTNETESHAMLPDNKTSETPSVLHQLIYNHHQANHNHKSKTAGSGHHPTPFRHHLQLVPMEDEPFGAVILKDERYVVSVMIPIGVGIIGAAIIIATLYTLRYIARKNAREIHFPDFEHVRAHPSCISSISNTDTTDRVVLLGEDDDDDF